jgi:RecA/RadA recombinase
MKASPMIRGGDQVLDAELSPREEALSRRCALRRSTQKIMITIQTRSAAELLSNSRRISTGCVELDARLGGGIPVFPITEICGEAGAGKTQLLLMLALTAQLSLEHGGLGGGVLYLCTEGLIPLSRLKDLLVERPQLMKALGEDALSHILLEERISDAESLWACVHDRLPLLLAAGFIKLVIIDSITAVFRGEFSGKESMHDRNSWFFGLTAKMKQLATQHDCAFVISNQISYAVDIGAKKAALGLAWSACINQRLFMEFAHDPENQNLDVNVPQLVNVSPRRRVLSVEFSPQLPSGIISANCTVSKRGFHCL